MSRPTASLHAFAAGLLWLGGCGFNVLDGLASGSGLVTGDASSDAGIAPHAEGGRAPDDARSDALQTSDASPDSPDSQVTADTGSPTDASSDVSSVDDDAMDAESPATDGESLDASDVGDALAADDATVIVVKLTSPSTPVTASAHTASYVPTYTLDGLLTTRWAGSGDGVFITYDLGTERTLTTIRVAWYMGNLRIYTFDLQTSIDNIVWTTVMNRRTSWSGTDLQAYGLPNSTARYVRIVGHKSTVDTYCNITELELWGY